jgi:hypothetical protein
MVYLGQKASSQFLLSLRRPVPVVVISSTESNLSVFPTKKDPKYQEYYVGFSCLLFLS